MRWFFIAGMVLCLTVCLHGADAPSKTLPVEPTPLNADYHCKLAAWHLAVNVSEKDWPFVKFISWYNTKASVLKNRQKAMCWWIQQMSFSSRPYKPSVVPKSSGRLWAIDLRDYRWNNAAWESVAQNSPYFQEPWIDNKTAVFLRNVAGGVPLENSKKLAEKERYPIITIVRADWLFRETIETERSKAYYDLLFARQRFKVGKVKKAVGEQKWRTETRTVYHSGGDYVYPDDTGRISRNVAPGRYEVELRFKVKKEVFKKVDKVEFVDFPRNLDDWNDAFGVTEITKFLAKEKINLKRGAVVAGSLDDPKSGSIVARNNRVTETIRGPFGHAMRTYDVANTAKNDFLETSPDVAIGKNKFDAGEALAYLPNGGQAGFLFNAKGERIEVAATTFAHNKIDNRYVDVRTMMGCVGCHAPDAGFIPPRNLVKEMLKAGVTIKIKDKEKRNAFEEYFLGWEKQIKQAQEPYLELLKYCTTEPVPAYFAVMLASNDTSPAVKLAITKEIETRVAGWDGTRLQQEFFAFRNEYDDPVTMETAALEVGIPKDLFGTLIVKSPTARLNLMVRGKSMPRSIWERDHFRNASLYLNAEK